MGATSSAQRTSAMPGSRKPAAKTAPAKAKANQPRGPVSARRTGARVPESAAVWRAAPARELLGRQRDRDEAEQQQRERQRRLDREQPVPGLVDGGRERVVVEDRDGAEVGQGLHGDECRAAREPGTRERNRDPHEPGPGPVAERLRGLQHARAVRQEGAARHQVDVGVAREAEHRDHAAGRADRRHGQVRAEPGAQRRRHRARVVERRDRHEGEHVRRHRHRQVAAPRRRSRGRETRRRRSARRAKCRAPRRSRRRRRPAPPC